MHTAHCTRHTTPSFSTRHTLSGCRCETVVLLLLLAISPFTQAVSQGLSIALTPTDYNGYNISCFGKKDGGIDATVSGGTPPYTFKWSTGDITQDLTDIPSGFYELYVTDATGAVAQSPITLTEPEALKVEAEPFKYPSGHHVSCHECYNGSIDVTVSHGVPPYTYDWGDEVYTQDRSGLGALVYMVKVVDANGCGASSDQLHLRQPERNDWTMEGNANTDPSAHFFGTTDATDVVFKSNGTEAFRLLPDGRVRLSSLAPGLLGLDTDGTLKNFPYLDPQPCNEELFPFWRTGGNLLQTCDGARNALGSLDMEHVNFITNNTVRMRMTYTGHIQVGGSIEDWPHDSSPGRFNILQGHGSWITLRTQGSNPQEDVGYWAFHNPPEQDRLMFAWASPDGVFSPIMSLHQSGKVQIGDVNLPSDDYTYGLYLEKGLLTERVKVAVKNTNEWRDFVFNPNYPLMSLQDLKSFIAANGHLPDIPSAECMVEDGLDVVRINALLLQKIEELTLHIIQLNEKLEKCASTINSQN